MISVQVPEDWTPAEAHAAITLIEAIFDALWRQYPEASEEYFPCHLDNDSCEPPPNDHDQPNRPPEADTVPWYDEIPF